MKKFWIDSTAIVFAMVGIVLMALTLAWRVNPAEGSVIPQFLRDNVAGQAVHLLLLVTCMPVWFAAVLLLPANYPASVVRMIVLQAIVYFLIGKAVGVCFRRLFRKEAT